MIEQGKPSVEPPINRQDPDLVTANRLVTLAASGLIRDPAELSTLKRAAQGLTDSYISRVAVALQRPELIGPQIKEAYDHIQQRVAGSNDVDQRQEYGEAMGILLREGPKLPGVAVKTEGEPAEVTGTKTEPVEMNRARLAPTIAISREIQDLMQQESDTQFGES